MTIVGRLCQTPNRNPSRRADRSRIRDIRVIRGLEVIWNFLRNLAPNLTQYLGEHRKEGSKPMNHQDTGTIIITFLLLLPWLGRAAVSAIAIWRERIETQGRKAKTTSEVNLRGPRVPADTVRELRHTSGSESGGAPCSCWVPRLLAPTGRRLQPRARSLSINRSPVTTQPGRGIRPVQQRLNECRLPHPRYPCDPGCSPTFRVTSRRLLRITSVNGRK